MCEWHSWADMMWSCEVYTYVHMFMKQGVWRMMLKVVVGYPSMYSSGCWWELLWIIQDVTSCMKSALHVCAVTMATVHYSPCIDMPHCIYIFWSRPLSSTWDAPADDCPSPLQDRSGCPLLSWCRTAPQWREERTSSWNLDPHHNEIHTHTQWSSSLTAFIIYPVYLFDVNYI